MRRMPARRRLSAPIGTSEPVEAAVRQVARAAEHASAPRGPAISEQGSRDALSAYLPAGIAPRTKIRQVIHRWDGNPARLKPPPDALLAAEVAALADGADALARRARATGDLRLACQLAERAVQADPASAEASAVRAQLYSERKNSESSLMAKAIFGEAAAQSDKHHKTLTGPAPAPPAES